MSVAEGVIETDAVFISVLLEVGATSVRVGTVVLVGSGVTLYSVGDIVLAWNGATFNEGAYRYVVTADTNILLTYAPP